MVKDDVHCVRFRLVLPGHNALALLKQHGQPVCSVLKDFLLAASNMSARLDSSMQADHGPTYAFRERASSMPAGCAKRFS